MIETCVTHSRFATMARKRLDSASIPVRLFQKAKKLGTWNPSDIDFSRDREDWRVLTDTEKDAVLRVTSGFAAGEESVALDLVPLVLAVARQGQLEEEIFLASFLWEEAKHVEFFCRFLDELGIDDPDLSRYHTAQYRKLFYEELPGVMHSLLAQPSPANLARATVTYNLIVEGMMAETGYHGYLTALERVDKLPGLRQGIYLVKRDESRHIAFGVYLLSRLVAENPSILDVIEERLAELLPMALGIVNEAFESYAANPFGLVQEEFVGYATAQFMARQERIRGAAGKSVEEVRRLALEDEAA